MSGLDREQLVDRLGRFLEGRPEIVDGYLFGSQARGDAQPHSDVDVAVYVDAARLPPAPYGYAAELTTELIALLHDNRVDVVVLNDAGPLLYHRVLRDGIRVVTRDLAASTTREGRALSRYCDYLPHLRKIEQALNHRIARGSTGR